MNYVGYEFYAFIISFASLIFIMFSIGAVSYSINEINNIRFIKTACNDTNCTVNIVNGICFAKVLNLTTMEFKKVECDKKRKGNYEIILPCDITHEGNPKIKCLKKNKNVIGVRIILIILLFFSIIAWVGCFMICVFLLGLNINEQKEKKQHTTNTSSLLDNTY